MSMTAFLTWCNTFSAVISKGSSVVTLPPPHLPKSPILYVTHVCCPPSISPPPSIEAYLGLPPDYLAIPSH